jgi:hypothetical protein
MNKQTMGPLCVAHTAKYGAPFLVSDTGKLTVANSVSREEDAELLAAAYTAFDRAGRELGIDAATLARSVDLVGILRFISTIKDMEPSGPLTKCDHKTSVPVVLASCDAHALANVARRAKELCVLDKTL